MKILNRKISAKQEGLFLFTSITFILLIITNILSSQNIPPLYFQFIEESKKSIVLYLDHIKKLSIFPQELMAYKNKYGAWVEEQVYQNDKKRDNKIASLEEALVKNPKSRDVLYQLSLLYSEKGDVGRAQEYLRRVKEVDPSIKN